RLIVGHNGRLIVYSVNKDIDFDFLKYTLDIELERARIKNNIQAKIQKDMLENVKKYGFMEYQEI
ncbi:head protein, partial [Staphylococcus pseudintermedius]